MSGGQQVSGSVRCQMVSGDVRWAAGPRVPTLAPPPQLSATAALAASLTHRPTLHGGRGQSGRTSEHEG